MSAKARARIARVEAHRPRPAVAVVGAASGVDRTAQLDEWIARVLDSAPPPARG